MFKMIYHAVKGGEKRLLFAARYARFLGLGAGSGSGASRTHSAGVRRWKSPLLAHRRPSDFGGKTTDIPAFEDTFIFGHYEVDFESSPKVIVDAEPISV